MKTFLAATICEGSGALCANKAATGDNIIANPRDAIANLTFSMISTLLSLLNMGLDASTWKKCTPTRLIPNKSSVLCRRATASCRNSTALASDCAVSSSRPETCPAPSPALRRSIDQLERKLYLAGVAGGLADLTEAGASENVGGKTHADD